MFAYLGFTDDGAYQLCVSVSPLNPAGMRLERGKNKRLPENVAKAAQNPNDPQLAIAGLISLRNFFNGTEQGPGAPEFGSDELPLRRRRKK